MATNDVFARFRPPPGSWQCKCLVWNKPGSDVCASCEVGRDGATPAAASAAAAPAAALGFGTLFGGGGSAAASGGGFKLDLGASNGAPASGGFVLNLGGDSAAAAAPASSGFQLNLGAAPAAPGFATAPIANGGFVLNLGGAAASGGGGGAGAGAGGAPSGFQFGVRKMRSAEELSSYFDAAAAAGSDTPSPLTTELTALPDGRPVSSRALGGVVLVTGSGDCDQLGLGDDGDLAEKPTLVADIKKQAVAAVGVGGLHNGVVTTGGKLWTWGCNDDKVLGREGVENRPGIVKSLSKQFITAVSCGDSHMAALNAAGDVYAWGTYKGAEGYIGFSSGVKRQAEPLLLAGVARYGRAHRLSCGADHTAVVTTSGIAVAWGNGEQGQLGRPVVSCTLRGSRSKNVLLTPYRMVVGKGKGRRGMKVDNVFCGGYHTFAITEDGNVYATGLNNYGQLGLGDVESRNHPELVEAFEGKRIHLIRGGLHHSVALSEDGRVYTWGRGDSGQLGLVEEQAPVGACSHVPLQLPTAFFGGKAVRLLGTGSSHSVAVTDDNQVYTWGYGDMYQLGNADMKDEPRPFRVTSDDLGDRQVFSVGAGGQHTVMLAADPAAYAKWVKSPPPVALPAGEQQPATRAKASKRSRRGQTGPAQGRSKRSRR